MSWLGNLSIRSGIFLLALGAAWRLSSAIGKPAVRDLGERSQAEQALRAHGLKLDLALWSMSDAVCICELDGRFVEFNDAFASFHRFTDRADCGRALEDYRNILEMVIPNGGPVPWENWPLARALRGETGTNAEYRLRRKDTGATWMGSYSFAPILLEDGTIAGAVMTARDVTAMWEVQFDLESSHFALQQLIASRDQVQEEERKRIARELHDDLQQTLAAIRMDLQVITDRFGAVAPELPALVVNVDRLAEQAVASTRRIVNDLRPPMLEDLGLLPALEAMASQFSQQFGIACTVEAPDDVADELLEARSIALCLYRVTQEALNNVGKHSRASEAYIRLSKVQEKSISLRVEDNGRALAPTDRGKSESFGILGMQERVWAHGGIMNLDGVPGRGTILEVVLPLAGVPLAKSSGAATDAGRARPADVPRTRDVLEDEGALPRLLSRATDQMRQDVIDAFPGSVAVLDRRGTIRFVNRGWTQFAERNGNPGMDLVGPGASYLDVCRRSSLVDASALTVLKGMEEVLYEGRAAFSCEYPCHSPNEQRWYRMHATPMANGDVIVGHVLLRSKEAARVRSS